MKKLLFATSNLNKLKELQSLIGDEYSLSSLKDIDCKEDIPETSDTISGNAIQKAEYIQNHFKLDCFADDTGLEVNALNNEPGVYSARYAGPQRNADDNMNKLITNLKDKKDWSARFVTVIALLINNHIQLFEGVLEGQIIEEKKGNNGFGYDPIFVPKGYQKTLAEMTLKEKNEISHRALATKKLVTFLKQEI